MAKITLGRWTREYDREAKGQGWTLFDADGFIRIMKIDEPELGEPGDRRLRSDQQALNIVFRQAAAGCRMSLIALFLHGLKVYEEGWPTMKPAVYELPK